MGTIKVLGLIIIVAVLMMARNLFGLLFEDRDLLNFLGLFIWIIVIVWALISIYRIKRKK